MSPQLKYGLIVGAVAFVLAMCVTFAIGICGPLVGILAGLGAGFLAAREVQAPTKGDGARVGAIAGGIAGAFTALGQILAGIGTLLFLLQTEATPLLGQLPQAGDSAGQIGYWLGGMGFGVCFGFIGLIVAALCGAGAGYLATSDQSAAGMTVDGF